MFGMLQMRRQTLGHIVTMYITSHVVNFIIWVLFVHVVNNSFQLILGITEMDKNILTYKIDALYYL